MGDLLSTQIGNQPVALAAIPGTPVEFCYADQDHKGSSLSDRGINPYDILTFVRREMERRNSESKHHTAASSSYPPLR